MSPKWRLGYTVVIDGVTYDYYFPRGDEKMSDKGILQGFQDRNATGIQDHPDQSYFEFYPAGYAHQTKSGVARQVYHKQIFEQATKENPDAEDIENLLFPIDVDDHSIILMRDPNNDQDPHALSIFLLIGGDKFDIGYVPKKISKQIDTDINRITEGRIYRVKERAYNKYYSTKVVIGYDNRRFLGENTLSYERLADIIDELNEE